MVVSPAQMKLNINSDSFSHTHKNLLQSHTRSSFHTTWYRIKITWTHSLPLLADLLAWVSTPSMQHLPFHHLCQDCAWQTNMTVETCSVVSLLCRCFVHVLLHGSSVLRGLMLWVFLPGRSILKNCGDTCLILSANNQKKDKGDLEKPVALSENQESLWDRVWYPENLHLRKCRETIFA